MSHFQTKDQPSLVEAVKWGEEVLKLAGRPDATIDAKLLLRHLLDMSETHYLLRRQECLSREQKISYEALIEERKTGKPLQYIIGTQEFMGLVFEVDERVLVPRQDTETLIETLTDLAKEEPIRTGIDIGTGSGCISIALAYYIKDLHMIALDYSAEALCVARKNVQRHHLESRVKCLESDLFGSYPNENGKVDLIVSNPPYISIEDYKELMKEVKEYEPQMALTDDCDGLTFYKKISKAAKDYLKPNGIIAYEIGYNQAKEVTIILEQEGFKNIRIVRDLAGKDRVIVARSPF